MGETLKMRWSLSEVRLALGQRETELAAAVAKTLKIKESYVHALTVVRRGLDARNKSRIQRVYTVEFGLSCPDEVLTRIKGAGHLKPAKQVAQTGLDVVRSGTAKTVVVVGMGPAGLLAALELARSGHQVTLVERGAPVEQRIQDVEQFWSGAALDPQSNVQFGEGGAGTFSDGKLTTRVKNPLSAKVLDIFISCGAPENIRIDAKPHIGTDILRSMLVRFRGLLVNEGVSIRYNTCLTDLNIAGGAIRGVVVNGTEHIHCDTVVLATGHSARDIYSMLQRKGMVLQPKPFALGVRVEHPTELINQIQYGMKSHPHLPAAEYALTWNDRVSGRGVYSFCMCPGGEVVLSSSEADTVVVNGMSLSGRDGAYSNSALVVSVRPEDFADADNNPLSGVDFQRYWERKAYGNSRGYCPPAQNMLSFLGRGYAPVSSTCRPKVREEELRNFIPDFVYTGLTQALPYFERKMKGFITQEASLVALESRTSAPVRIVRSENFQAPKCAGLYPVGEGAGYAGGIMSAAIDGLKAAHAINGSRY